MDGCQKDGDSTAKHSSGLSQNAIPADRNPFLQLPVHQTGADHRIVLHPRKSFGVGRRLKHQQPPAARPPVAIHQVPAMQTSLLKGLLEQHVERTGSEKAAALLADWSAAKKRFKLLVPPSEREAMGLADKQAVAA